MDSDEPVDSPFPIVISGLNAGRAVLLPDREEAFPLPIRSVTVYGQRVLARCSYTELLDTVCVKPLTKFGFHEAFPDFVPVQNVFYMEGIVPKGSRIGLVTDNLRA